MKFLIPLLSFFLGNMKGFFKETSSVITQQVVLQARALTQLLVSTVAALVFCCVGISMLIISLAKQLDSQDSFYFTDGMFLYLALSILAIGLLLYSLRKKTWLRTMSFNEKPAQGAGRQGSPLEAAIAMLVLDFVEERQKRRSETAGKDAFNS